jgi:hypothetical protein
MFYELFRYNKSDHHFWAQKAEVGTTVGFIA